MKKLLMLLLLAAPVSAQTVTPQFTQGRCNPLLPPRLILNGLSNKKSMVVITIMEWFKRYAKRRHRCGSSTTFACNYRWRPLVSRDHDSRHGVVETIDITETIDSTSTTTSLSIFSGQLLHTQKILRYKIHHRQSQLQREHMNQACAIPE